MAAFDYIISVTGDCESLGVGSIEIILTGGTSPYTVEWVEPNLGADVVDTEPSIRTTLTGGTYGVRVNDSTLPINSEFYINIPVSTGLCTSILAVQDTTCGLDNGSVTATTTANYSSTNYYLYDENDILLNSITTNLSYGVFSSLSAGTYYIVGEDLGGCTSTGATFIITSSVDFDFGIYSVPNSSCNGPGLGKLYVTGQTGTGPYTYLWSNGLTTSSITGLTSGSYSVQVTDSNGCSKTNQGIVSDVDPIGFGLFTSIPPTCLNNDGSLTLQITGGTAPYYYSASTGYVEISYSKNLTISGLGAGDYSVLVTDAAYCSTTNSTNLSSPSGFQAVTIDTKNSTCSSSDGSVTIAVTGGTPPFTYKIINPSGNTISYSDIVSNYTFPGLSTGTYTALVTDSSGCTYSEEIYLISNDKFIFYTSITGTTCGLPNGSIDVYLSGDTTYPVDYFIDNANGIIDSSLSAITFNNVSSGQHAIKVIDNSGCIQQSLIYVSPSQTLDFTLFSTSCGNGSDGSISVFILGGQPPFSFVWSDNVFDNPQSTKVQGLTAGTYSLTVIDSSNCSLKRTTTIECNKSYSSYEIYTMGQEEFTVEVGTKCGLLELLNIGFNDITVDETDCILEEAEFVCKITVESPATIYSGSFYTTTSLLKAPEDNLWYNKIKEILFTIPGVTNVTINAIDNTITIQSIGSELIGKKIKIELVINYDIKCPDIIYPTPTATPSVAVTKTPTRTPTRTPTKTPTQTKTPTRTPNSTLGSTPPVTPSHTKTPQITQTKTPTKTPTPTKSIGLTPEPTNTPSSTKTNTPTQTPTKTSTPNITPSKTSTPTPTPTPPIECISITSLDAYATTIGFDTVIVSTVGLSSTVSQDTNITLTVSTNTGTYYPGITVLNGTDYGTVDIIVAASTVVSTFCISSTDNSQISCIGYNCVGYDCPCAASITSSFTEISIPANYDLQGANRGYYFWQPSSNAWIGTGDANYLAPELTYTDPTNISNTYVLSGYNSTGELKVYDEYYRMAWSDIQNDDGSYNFSYFTNAINRCAANPGRKFHFRIWTCPLDWGDVPSFLKDGVRFIYIPEYSGMTSNPWLPKYGYSGYTEAVKELNLAVRSHIESMDGMKYVGSIAIGSFGVAGEWQHYYYDDNWGCPNPMETYNIYPQNTTEWFNLIKIYTDVWPDVFLTVPIAASIPRMIRPCSPPLDACEYIMQYGKNDKGMIGFRVDHIGDCGVCGEIDMVPGSSNGTVDTISWKMDRWKLAKLWGEPNRGVSSPGSCCATNNSNYSSWSEIGVVYGGGANDVGDFHFSQIGNGNYNVSGSALQTNINNMNKRLGYRIILSAATVPTLITQNIPFNISTTWFNDGNAPVYEKYNVWFQLRNTITDAVVWQNASTFTKFSGNYIGNGSETDVNSFDINKLLLPVRGTSSISPYNTIDWPDGFTGMAPVTQNDTLTVTGVTSGNYNLVLIIQDEYYQGTNSNTLTTGNVRVPLVLAIEGRTSYGGYVLKSNITVY